jgi:hypothetical protein
MAFLLLNFAEYGESGKNYERDFYNKPLKKQYEALASRYSQLKMFEYERFIQACFLVFAEKKYYISMPSIIRDESLGNNNFLNNIVIRSPRDSHSEPVLPKGLELILIGDIKMSPYGEFIVKGIELIDTSIFKHGETEREAFSVCAFSKKTFVDKNDGIIKSKPAYGIRPDVDSSVLTRDFMEKMYTSTNNYTVPDPVSVRKIYNKWKEYINFRRHYLEEQGKETLPFDDCNAIECYTIQQRDYQDDRKKYDDYILDGLDTSKKDEQIIVTKKFDNSDPFELIQIIIEKNKKELFENTVKGKGEIPDYEQKLKHFTRSEIILQGEDGKKWINVDERYRLFHKDIPPDYSEIEVEFSGKLEVEYNQIEGQFAEKKKKKVAEYIRSRSQDLEKMSKINLSEFKAGLDSRFEHDVTENNDEAIRRDYAAQIKQKEDKVQKQIAEMEKYYKDEIDSIKEKKEKDPDNKAIKVLEQQCDAKSKVFTEDKREEKK